MKSLQSIIAFCFLFILSQTGYAQANIFMTNGTVEACEGSFQDDSGGSGAEGAPYSDTDYIFTICPSIPGDVIQVDFVAFSLQTSPNPNNSDYLSVYDGDDTSANSLGSYSGNSLQGIQITGTIFNVTGCLTFQFTCNTGNTNTFPGWEALISCTTPCATPTSASVISDPEPENANVQSVGACIGQPITFSDNGSFAEAGFTLENWIWNFGDGVVEEGTDTEVTHIYEEPGEYIVTLYVQDNNGCFSLNLDPLQVLISTIPIFNTEFDAQICLGGQGTIDANPLQNVTWTALPPQVVSGETFLADGAGFSFSSELTFDFFEPDAILETCDDLYSIFINIEHSYLGDLGMTIECPDGTMVNIIDWGENGGGGTFLGEAVDDGSVIPGVGWDYGWQPGLTNGNLDDGNASQYTFTDNNGNNVTNNIVDPGFYESDEDLCNLVGCPLNGTWTFSVIDNLAIDNGYIFEWGMEFNPVLYPDITTFTPVVGLGSDSSWWEGPYIVETSDDANLITIEPPELGLYEYTYFATNNFSCTLDTTVVVEVVDGPVIDAGDDATFCGDLQLEAVILSNDFTPPPCQFTISMYNTTGDNYGWDGGSVDVSVDGLFIGNYTTFFGTVDQTISISSGQVLEIYFYPSLWGSSGNEFVILDDNGDEIFNSGEDPAEGIVFDMAILCVGDGQVQYEWSPPEGVDDPSSPTPNVIQVSGETEFEVTAWPAGFPGCASTDVVTITPAFDFDVSFQNPSCAGNDGFVNVNIDGSSGNPPWTIEFYEGGALVESIDTDGGTELFDNLLPGDYSVAIINNQCTYDIETPIEQPDIIEIETSADSTICINGTAILSAWSTQDVDDSWTYIWDQGLPSGMTVFDNPEVETTYSVYAIDDFGCESATFETTVSIHEPLSVQTMPDLEICQGDDITLTADSFDGGDGGPYNFNWSLNGQNIGNGSSLDYAPNFNGDYCVTITDGCESPAVEDCLTIDIEVPIDVMIASDTTKGCYPAEIVFSVPMDPEEYSLAQWEISDGTFVFNAQEFTHTFEDAGLYDVSLTITSNAGCVYSATFENYISIFQRPTAGYHAQPQPTTIPDTEIQFYDESIGQVVEWLWVFDMFNVLGVSTEENPVFDFPYDVGGDYPVTLFVTDINGCQDTITRIIEINDLLNVYIPNSFSPNNDGINEAFFVEGTDIDPTRFRLTVFNRWGEKVFETDNPNQAWDGSHLGGDFYIEDGVYTYQAVVYSITTAERHDIVGSVTVFR